MKSFRGFGLVLLAGWTLLAPGIGAVETKPDNPPSTTDQTTGKSWLECLADKMIPRQKLNEAAGFFGPVTKKYLPDWEKFCGDYLAAVDKRAIVRKALPLVDAALAEAKAMKIPPKYEKQKSDYIKMFEAFVLAAKLYVKFGE